MFDLLLGELVSFLLLEPLPLILHQTLRLVSHGKSQ